MSLVSESAHCSDIQSLRTERVLSAIPTGPQDDTPVPSSLKSATPATERGYDLVFTADGNPLRGRPCCEIDKDKNADESGAGSCQKKRVVRNLGTAGIFTFFCEHGYCYGYA